MTDRIDDELNCREANRLYQALFKSDAPQEIKDRFSEPSRALNATAAADDVRRYYALINETTDLESVELAGRLYGRLPLLTSKVRLVVHLAETLPQNSRYFVNERDGLLRGLFVVAAGVIRSVAKFPRGWLYLRKTGSG